MSLVAAGVLEHERDVPPFRGLERVRRHRLGRGQRFAQPGQVEIGHAQIQQQRVEARYTDGGGGRGSIRCGGHPVTRRAEHPKDGVTALGIALEHQHVHGGHGS